MHLKCRNLSYLVPSSRATASNLLDPPTPTAPQLFRVPQRCFSFLWLQRVVKRSALRSRAVSVADFLSTSCVIGMDYRSQLGGALALGSCAAHAEHGLSYPGTWEYQSPVAHFLDLVIPNRKVDHPVRHRILSCKFGTYMYTPKGTVC